MKKIISIIGARPQFIKHCALDRELTRKFNSVTVHTGQHYDPKLSDIFFEELKMAPPSYSLSLTHTVGQGAQTGEMMNKLEEIIIKEKPDAVLVYGDTNSTLAGVLVAVKLSIPIIHIEAGLRSFNMEMPEEINRIIADRFAWLLFCPNKEANENLIRDNVPGKVYVTGDVMIDMIKLIEPFLQNAFTFPYCFATIHRPYNTDDPIRLRNVLSALDSLSYKVILSLHPRTYARMEKFAINKNEFGNIIFKDPVGYLESISLQKFSLCVITDSGGMQKEAYALQKKCVTIRTETEWVDTLKNGWNSIIFHDLTTLNKAIISEPGNYDPDIFGDGNASFEIVDIISNEFQ
ncbi:non-hydrolyzing UDP-N-acetylglucosamine 2-epimerase [Terrimonas alba]|uniref:non-hydrolyzing UDP-N-acetylglucosamine 2-epimerase n=1 Tax=Terrimonas alba TaxID=3349636 RepID=UPI0035F3C0B0